VELQRFIAVFLRDTFLSDDDPDNSYSVFVFIAFNPWELPYTQGYNNLFFFLTTL